MSMPTPEESHEFVVSPELAEAASHLGVALHAGDRVRFEVVRGDDEQPSRSEGEAVPQRELPWIGSFNSGKGNLGRRAEEILRAEFGTKT
jgi:hypothetical protein